MPARTPTGRPGVQALKVSAATVGLLLLYSCAAPGTYRSGGLFTTPAPAMPPPVLDTVQVHELRGPATVQIGTQRLALKPDAEIHENQPVQVGPRSTLRLAMGQRGLIELGPGSRVVLHKLPRNGKGEERATWLRLEQGYLRVVWSDETGNTPMEVSFGRWAARIGSGEHFFDSRGSTASACSTSGTMRLSGVPEWTPKSLSEPCVTLEPHHSPVEIALREKDWNTLRTKRRLQPTLARAADQQASRAVARLERDRIQPVAWKPASPTGAFSADLLAPAPSPAVTVLSSHTPPVIQIPAEPEPEPAPALAFAPPSPVTVVTQPEAVPVMAPEDVPTVESSQVVMAAPQPPVIVAPTYDAAEAQALMDSAPTAAGPPTPYAATEVATPTLKWTDGIQTDTANLQPVTVAPAEPAPAEPAVVIAPGPATVTTTSDPAAQIAYSPTAEDATAPMVESPIAPNEEAGRAEWIVNVATYADPDLAAQHAQQLSAQNFKATVRPETVRGRSSYRVVIEGIPSEAAAQSAVADLGTRWGVRSAWAMRKR